MSLTWRARSLNGPLIPGRYYQMTFKIPFTVNDGSFLGNGIEAAIKGAASLTGKVRMQNVTFKPDTLGGKSNGTFIEIVFQGLNISADGRTEAGVDPRVVLSILGVVILGVCAANGTLYKFAEAVDTGAEAAKQAFNPVSLVAIVLILIVLAPMLRGMRNG